MLAKKTCQNTIGQMLCIESALVKKTYLEINTFTKMQYERNNPVNWRDDKCVLRKMPLRVESTSFKTPDDETTYGHFIIRFEHKFIRNIYTNDQIKESQHLNTLKNCYEIYQQFMSISVGLTSMFNNYNKNHEINTVVSYFIVENFPDGSIEELKN